MENLAKPPMVSVIMGVYNQRNQDYLEKAIFSVLYQTFTDFEFIICNDGSDVKILKYLERYAQLDGRIVLINHSTNHGLAYSLNSCIKVARGKYLARMDDDDICALCRLQVQVDYMEKHPEISFLGCNAGLIDEKGVWGHRKMPEVPDKKAFLKFSPYIHPTVMMRRAIFDNQEAYRVDKDMLRCEDYELFMRLWHLGYIGCNLQKELFYYREGRASYNKRKFCYRIDEMKFRYKSFKELGLFFPFGWLYVLRPLAAAVVPSAVICRMKKLCQRITKIFRRNEENAEGIGKAFENLPENLKRRFEGI